MGFLSGIQHHTDNNNEKTTQKRHHTKVPDSVSDLCAQDFFIPIATNADSY
jgi:hypothetical protein